MKRIAIVFICILFASSAFAMGNRSYNANRFGSDDHQRKDHTVTVDPDRPVHQVPEPATIILLSAGLIGLAAYGRRK